MNTTTKPFTIGDTVTLRHGKWHVMTATIGGVSETGDLLRLNVQAPPLWFHKMLQARGILLGAHSDWLMFMFRDHAGTWTDQQSLEQFTIE